MATGTTTSTATATTTSIDQDSQQAALLLIDNQRGFAHPTHWGPARSNPQYEENVSRLLDAARRQGLFVVHVRHLSDDPHSVLHPTAPAPAGHPAGGRAVDFEPATEPRPGEPIVEKHVNSAFIGTHLEAILRERRVRCLFVAGLSTDHCVSTTVRMAANLHVCDVPRSETEREEEGGRASGNEYRNEGGKDVVPGRVVLVEDATACWQKPSSIGGKWDAETVHAVHVESLREFAEIMTTDQAIEAMR